MKNLRVAISSPHEKNLYSLLVTKICADDPEIDVVGVCCLKVFSLKRILFEAKRLGPRLIQKILSKYFYKPQDLHTERITALIDTHNLKDNSLTSFCKNSHIDLRKISDPNDPNSINFLSSAKPDVIISIGSIILRDAIISIPTLGVLNVHKGILPDYRGMGVTEWPLLHCQNEEEAKLGVTSHLIEQGVDTGPILAIKLLNLKELNHVDEIEPRYLEITIDAMLDALTLAKNDFKSKTSQHAGEGKQYFELHHRLKDKVDIKLNKYFHGKK
mgnify:FL=1|tara:strand:+ start:410 stop:1225 length:816 start_codon:yes stop_codon:yes gene_type:complete